MPIWLRRALAYQRVFQKDNTGKPIGDGRDILLDLKAFCRGERTPFVRGLNGADPIETARWIGRQEVYDRIISQINLDHRSRVNLEEEDSDR